MTPNHERWFDVYLAVVALALAALQLAVTTGDAAAPVAGVAEVRLLEDFGRIHDAGDAYSQDVRALIGLEGTAADTPQAVVEAAAERLLELPPGRNLRLVVAAMAAAYDVPTVASAQLDAVVADPELPEAVVATVADLRRLAEGHPLDTIDRVTATLSDLGASGWLLDRVRARQLTLRGEDAAAGELRAEAVRAAVSAVGARMGTLLIQLGLLILGALGFVLVPWLRPRLRRRGLGLGPAPSPFPPSRVQRVILLWFIASMAAGWAFSGIAASFGSGADTRLFAALLALQILTHGAIGVALIQRLGRPPEDTRPLGPALGLGAGMLPGRAAGVLLWVLPGLGIAALVTFTAQILNLQLFGPPSTTQGAIELLVTDAAPTTFAILILSAVFVAPLVEEILFRGYLFRALRTTIGTSGAVIFSGLVFGAVHLDPERILPLAALGTALALLYEWSGSLLVPIAVHGLWNLLQLVSVWVIYHAP